MLPSLALSAFEDTAALCACSSYTEHPIAPVWAQTDAFCTTIELALDLCQVANAFIDRSQEDFIFARCVGVDSPTGLTSISKTIQRKH